MLIDTSFDFRADASGRDPDTYSPTLRLYHKLLWSKTLPRGRRFDLDDTVRGVYPHHNSELGEFFLCSDSVIPTFTRWDSLRRIIQLFTEEENEAFRKIGYTIGGMMVFPGESDRWRADHQRRPRVQQEDRRPVRSHARVHPPALPCPAQPSR